MTASPGAPPRTPVDPSIGSVAAARGAGILGALDGEFATMVARRARVADPTAVLALALAAKAVRLEHVCVALDDEGISVLWRDDDGEDVEVPAPSPAALRAALADEAGGLVEVVAEGAEVDERGAAPVVLSGPRYYLRRYAILEQRVAARLRANVHATAPDGLDVAVGALAGSLDDRQLLAVRSALTSDVSVIAGGPGTGKTTAIAALLEAARSLRVPLTVALAAPTGKAASRLDEAVRAMDAAEGGSPSPRAATIHSLLGIGRDGTARGPKVLDADLVVLDEASMVSLPRLSQVLDAVRPGARVVLVGDPDQLASIEVGAVLSDVVDARRERDGAVVVTTLATAHRFAGGEGVAALAAAVRAGSVADVTAVLDGDETLARCHDGAGLDAVVERVVDRAEALVTAARRGDAATALELLGALGVLCGTRRGRGSTSWWSRTVEARLVRRGVLRARDTDYVGRPLLVTRNDRLTGLTNGMTGVVVADGDEHRVAFDGASHPLASVPWTETAWAITIHKSQGSEFDEVVVSLPGPDSRVLTRELVYTAVTRARRAVTLADPAGSLEAALARRVARSSGLVARLRADQPPRDSTTTPVTAESPLGMEGST
jgi:exodeoxyribonuclease V alpha subunit